MVQMDDPGDLNDRAIRLLKEELDRIRQSEEYYRNLVESAIRGVSIIDNENKIVYVNPQITQTLGYAYDELIGEDFLTFVDEDYRDFIKTRLAECGENNKGQYDLKLRRKNGKALWALVSISPNFDKRKNIIGRNLMLSDITERKVAEMALQESEEKFRTLAEMSPVAIFFHCGDGFIYANPAAEIITGYSGEELNAMKFWELFDPKYSEMVRQRGLMRLRGEHPPSRYEVKLRTKREEKWMDITSARVLYKGMPSILTMGLDITQKKQSETALKTAKEEAELYVDIMSHDIGNMNQAMMGYLEMAMDTIKPVGMGKELLEKPLDVISNSSALIDNVKKLRRLQSGEIPLKVVDVGQILSAVKDTYANTPGREVTINYEPVSGYNVIANEILKDVFSSLVSNAIKHSSGPVTIDILTEIVSLGGKEYYRVDIVDNGPGITDELKKKLFANIKENNVKGLRRGIGLQLVKTFITTFHGEVWVEDRVPGDYTRGARFVILLPAVEK